jgi:hypothetical protein
MREAQARLTTRLREHDLGRDLEDAKITLNEYLDRWLATAVKTLGSPRILQTVVVLQASEDGAEPPDL